MKYLEQIEAEFLKQLNGTRDVASIARWVSEKVLESYKNGIKAGQKGATIIRHGKSRRSGPTQAQ